MKQKKSRRLDATGPTKNIKSFKYERQRRLLHVFARARAHSKASSKHNNLTTLWFECDAEEKKINNNNGNNFAHHLLNIVYRILAVCFAD